MADKEIETPRGKIPNMLRSIGVEVEYVSLLVRGNEMAARPAGNIALIGFSEPAAGAIATRLKMPCALLTPDQLEVCPEDNSTVHILKVPESGDAEIRLGSANRIYSNGLARIVCLSSVNELDPRLTDPSLLWRPRQSTQKSLALAA